MIALAAHGNTGIGAREAVHWPKEQLTGGLEMIEHLVQGGTGAMGHVRGHGVPRRDRGWLDGIGSSQHG